MDYITLSILLVIIGLILVSVYLIISWNQLKPELFPHLDIVTFDNEISPNEKAQQNRRWLNDVQSILLGVHRAVEKENSSENQVQIEAFKKFESVIPKLTYEVRSVITKSLDSAELHTLLIDIQNLYAYIVVVPNRHEYPHLIRRYAPFSMGWMQHIKLIKKTLEQRNDSLTLIGYLFFLSPDFKEGLILVSYADSKTELVPAMLVYDAELRTSNVKTWNASWEFGMS
jgi:hypothetical protein